MPTSNFHPHKVVGRGSETQAYLNEKINLHGSWRYFQVALKPGNGFVNDIADQF